MLPSVVLCGVCTSCICGYFKVISNHSLSFKNVIFPGRPTRERVKREGGGGLNIPMLVGRPL